MDGRLSQILRAFGGEPLAFWGSFAPNGSSTPLVASNGGPPGLKATTIAYAADGAFTLTLPAGFTPVGTPTIVAHGQAASLSEWFSLNQIGAYNPTTRQFVLQAHRAGTGREVPAAAGARIHWAILFNNSTGG